MDISDKDGEYSSKAFHVDLYRDRRELRKISS